MRKCELELLTCKCMGTFFTGAWDIFTKSSHCTSTKFINKTGVGGTAIIKFRKSNTYQPAQRIYTIDKCLLIIFIESSLLCSPPLRTRKIRPSFWLVDTNLVKPFTEARRSLLLKTQMALRNRKDKIICRS